MIDRLFTAALAFCLLAGGTAAIGSAWFEAPAPALAPALPAIALISSLLVAGTAIRRKGLTKVSS